ncbi:MAG: hypothetical protein K9M57_09305 [Phycisphaerae bacterium]|nr:hypothetical protein [Phycisphaerae bacterium]
MNKRITLVISLIALMVVAASLSSCKKKKIEESTSSFDGAIDGVSVRAHQKMDIDLATRIVQADKWDPLAHVSTEKVVDYSANETMGVNPSGGLPNDPNSVGPFGGENLSTPESTNTTDPNDSTGGW